jgi:hypothetical protein
MTRLPDAELRKFGLTVGGVFAVLGVVSWWRGHDVAPKVLWTIGALLIAPGLVAPALLAPVQRAWMRLALVLGHVNTRIILTAVFYLVMTPIGFVMRLFRDPLDRSLRDAQSSQWVKRSGEDFQPSRYERQF